MNWNNNGAIMMDDPKEAPSDSFSYRKIGNTLHVLNLCGIVAYATLIVGFPEYLDASWFEYGFCEPRHDGPNYWTTHDLSAYAMFIITLSGLLMRQYCCSGVRKECDAASTSTMADQLFVRASLGALGHACGHLLISHGQRHQYYPQPHETFWTSTQENPIHIKLSYAIPGYLFFWIPLFQTYMMHTTLRHVIIVAAMVQMVALSIPVRFGFAYAQTVLFGSMSIDQLLSLFDNHQRSKGICTLAHNDSHSINDHVIRRIHGLYVHKTLWDDQLAPEPGLSASSGLEMMLTLEPDANDTYTSKT